MNGAAYLYRQYQKAYIYICGEALQANKEGAAPYVHLQGSPLFYLHR
jgi:hypothetical protein